MTTIINLTTNAKLNHLVIITCVLKNNNNNHTLTKQQNDGSTQAWAAPNLAGLGEHRGMMRLNHKSDLVHHVTDGPCEKGGSAQGATSILGSMMM